MGDATGGVVVKYIVLACGLVWVVGLIAWFLLQGLHAASDAGRAGRPHPADIDNDEDDCPQP